MDDRFNTAAGWVLFSGVVALGLSSLSARLFHEEAPEKPGYPVEVADTSGGGKAEMSMAEALHMDGVDASKGEAIFAKCAACHTINQGGANGIGPNLHGVMGEPVGKGAGGYAFSEALAGHGGTWDWDTLNEWLKNPKAFAPGTKMTFAGLSKVEDRAAVALYLNSQGSNLPVPDFVAKAAEGAGSDAATADGAAGKAADGDKAAGDAAAAPAAGDAAKGAAPAK